MTEPQLLKYCLFYRGEALCPPSFDGKNEGKLWVAEKYVCEKMQRLIDPDDPQRSVSAAVGAYVSKWSPYDLESIMETYITKSENL